jgi:hypothetical protein
MEKVLFKSKEEFDSFIDENTCPYYVPKHRTDPVKRRFITEYWAEEPKKYPCIAVWEIQYDGNGPDILEYELVYPDDFETE